MKHFLLAFDHSTQQLVVQREFGEDAATAIAAYEELERKHFNNLRMDIVLIGSDSLESVKVTHPTYFPEERAKLLGSRTLLSVA